jgi:hypothetical protein
MMRGKPLPSRQRLNELFYYRDGVLYNRADRGAKAKAGTPAGSKTSAGYMRVRIGGIEYQQHRLIWKLVHGEDPEQIDHINGKPLDNRITNLRSVTHQENLRNRKLPSNSGTGAQGVHWRKRDSVWIAHIWIGGKQKYLGTFTNKQDAVAARKAAEKEHGYHENHGRAA